MTYSPVDTGEVNNQLSTKLICFHCFHTNNNGIWICYINLLIEIQSDMCIKVRYYKTKSFCLSRF